MFIRALFTLALTLVLATPAMADLTGVYGGIKFIDSYQTQWGGGRMDGTDSQNTVGMGFMVGYDFYARSETPVRVEIEYAFRSNFKSESNMNYGSTHVKSSLDYNMHTLMANAYYDFYNESIFTPYVGAGLGMAFLDGQIDMEFNGNQYSSEMDDTMFAWHVGGGVGVAITENVTADLGYRYLGTSSAYGEVGGNEVQTDISAHEFSIGVRFGF